MISFARQDLILRPIEKRLYLFADERSEGENNGLIKQCLYNILNKKKLRKMCLRACNTRTVIFHEM